jgi:hypothetical protein
VLVHIIEGLTRPFRATISKLSVHGMVCAAINIWAFWAHGSESGSGIARVNVYTLGWVGLVSVVVSSSGIFGGEFQQWDVGESLG